MGRPAREVPRKCLGKVFPLGWEQSQATAAGLRLPSQKWQREP
jgi:hypothetical protein